MNPVSKYWRAKSYPEWPSAHDMPAYAKPMSPNCSQLVAGGEGDFHEVLVLVVLSQFRVAGDMANAVQEAFQVRPHLVDDAKGFLRMEVLSPRDQPDEIWLFTYWTDEESYRVWHRSHQYKDAHKGIPKGMKLVPKCTSIRFLNHVAN